jgi:hypothetical protein
MVAGMLMMCGLLGSHLNAVSALQGECGLETDEEVKATLPPAVSEKFRR